MNDTVITVSHAKDDLWRSVVARHHVRRHHETRAGGTSQAKVKDLQSTVTLHHDVGRLQVLRQQRIYTRDSTEMGTGTVPGGTALLRSGLRTFFVPAPNHAKRFR